MIHLHSQSKIILQGLHDRWAKLALEQMQKSQTSVVAAIGAGSPESAVMGVPVYDLVEDVIADHEAIDASVIAVPAYGVLDAVREAIASEIKTLIITSRQVPPLDMVKILRLAHGANTQILGPQSQGIILPGVINVGSQEPDFFTPGAIAIISRFPQLTYEVATVLNQGGLGVSGAVHLGNEGIMGTGFLPWLEFFQQDPQTQGVVLIGKPASHGEEAIAHHAQNHPQGKPIVAYLLGSHFPLSPSLEDAATIISNQLSSSVAAPDRHQQTMAAYDQAQIPLISRPQDLLPQLAALGIPGAIVPDTPQIS